MYKGSSALLSILDSCSGIQCDTSKLSKNNSVTATQREQDRKRERAHESDLLWKKLLLLPNS